MARPNRYSPEEVIAALQATKGMLYLAAQQLRCSAETVLSYCRRYPRVAQAKRDARGILLDECELRLWRAIQHDQPWAIAFALKTLGKSRGYTERVESTGRDGEAITLRVVYDQSDRPRDVPQPRVTRNGQSHGRA